MKLIIYLADLTHTGLGTATEAFPLNIGLVASYCLKNFKNDVEVKLFKFPEDLKQAIDEKKPHLLGCSNYSWNSNLSYYFANYVKSIDKSIITVFGGTNYPYDMLNQKLFHKKRPYMDIHTFYEGEKSFSNIVERILSNRGNIEKMFETPIAGCQFLDKDEHLICGEKTKRIKFLDEIPSPYVTGLLDNFFSRKLTPLVETARGCPFKCNFCNAGDDYYNKVNQFSNDYVKEELTYIAKRSNMFDIGHVTLADNNFGMIPRDRKTVELIYYLKEKYGWPKSLSAWTGKNSKEKIIDATRLLGDTLGISMSVQSMDPKVMENISRSNIKLDHYEAIAKELSAQGRPQHAEVIIPLPEETFETHVKGLSDLMDTDVGRVTSHTLQILHGTPYADDKKYVKKHGYKTKFRIVPLDFGKYDNDYIFDYEEVGIATNTFSFKDYIESRKLTLIIDLCYNGNTFTALKKYILSNGLKRSEWIKYIYKNIDRLDKSFKHIIDSFVNETKSELWNSEEELVKYYSNIQNYKKLVSGEAGGNVLYRHTAWMYSSQSQVLINEIFQMTREFINTNNIKTNKIEEEMNELKKFANCITLDSFKFDNNIEVNKNFRFKYDILSWLKTENNAPLGDFHNDDMITIFFKYEQDQLAIKQDAINRYGDSLSGIVKLMQRFGGIQSFQRKAKII
jgi:radical SAM superfamily enzyme YgiQ (UPF0313 family)